MSDRAVAAPPSHQSSAAASTLVGAAPFVLPADAPITATRWLAAALLAWAVELALLLAFPPRGAARFAIDCAAWTVIGAVGAIAALRRARREPEGALGWRLIGFGGAILSAVSFLDAILFAAVGRLPLPPLLIAAMDNSTWVLFLAGLLAWTGRAHRSGAAVRAMLDGMLLAAACFLLVWWAGGGQLADRPDVSTLRAVRSVLPFALNCTSLGVIAYLAARSTVRLRGPLGWLATGHCGLLVGALGYAWASMEGTFYPGHPLDAVFQLPLFAFVMAAVAPSSLPSPVVQEDPGNGLGDVLTNLPAAAVMVVGSMRYFVGIPADVVTIVVGLSVLALLLARQFLAVRDVRHLTRTLEERVAARSRELETSQMALIQAQRMEAIGRLAGGVAHDFNNVLTAISGHIGLVREDLGDSHPALDGVQAVQDAVRCGSDLARRLFSFARPMPSSPRVVPAHEAVHHTVQLARGLGRGRVRVEVVIGEPEGSVFIDPVLLDQVLTNLAANAIDAMPNGGVLTIETSSVRVAASRDAIGPAAGAYVRFAVSDTGFGMDAQLLTRIFEPFFTTKAEGSGTGLGLSTAYALVTQAGGRISVESTPNEGTRFEVLLPLAERPAVREYDGPGVREALVPAPSM